MRLRSGIAVTIVILLLAVCSTSSAFGLKTHIWIGQRLLNEVQSSCRVTIADALTSINTEVCNSIRAHPGAFLSGVLGPDAFPDLITGQVTTHPGIEGDWTTGDWLSHMYSRASSGRDLAFAAGYVVHAASDVFAHTYVNAYAGDIFILNDERAVERRHFVLEKYIDAKLPGYSFDPSSLAPPADYLRDKLLHDGSASRQARKSGIALHIAAMEGIYRNVGDLEKNLDNLEKDAGKVIGQIVATMIDVNARIATGEPQLASAKATLEANKGRLLVEQKAYDEAYKLFKSAADAVDANKGLINSKALEAKVASEAADTAKKIADEATATAANLSNQGIDLQSQLDQTARTILVKSCNTVVRDGACRAVCFFCGSICEKISEKVCKTVDEVNSVWTNLSDQVNSAKKAANDATARAAQEAGTAATETAKATAALQAKVAAESLTAGLEGTRVAAKAAHDVAAARLKVERDATELAQKKADELVDEIKKLRETLVDSEAIKSAITELVTSSNILSFYAKNWRHGMDRAGSEFILASSRVSQGMLKGRSQFVSTYLEWWKCYGHAYTPVPPQFGQAVCAYEDFLSKMQNEVDKLVGRILPPPFNALFVRYEQLKTDIKTEVANKVGDAGLEFAKLVAPDATTADFIELLVKPENATAAKLNEVYSVVADAGGKKLLVFESMTKLIDVDLHLRNDQLDSEAFAALVNALVLSKIALMDTNALKGLVWVLGGDPSAITPADGNGRYSILSNMVRSIDGNHQWQAYGLPYPRTGEPPQPSDAERRRYGYGPKGDRPGLDFFNKPDLRSTIFPVIFKGPMSGSLSQHPGMASYPFKDCAANPFPVAFSPDGVAAPSDLTCDKASKIAVRPERSLWRRALNRLRLNPYDPW